MDISILKLELIELLLHTEKEAVLEKVGAVLRNQADDIVSSVLGEPLGVELYNKKLQKSELDFENGNVISHYDLKKKYNLDKE